MSNPTKFPPQNLVYRKPENFLNAELDAISSSYKMLMYREGFSYPNTYYSKKKEFDEPQDKEYLMLSMIERFIGRNNCFFRKYDQSNGKTYSPATLIEFWRIFQDDTEERLVLRMFHPTKNIIPFEVFDYLRENEGVKMKLYKYYELMRVGKTDAIGVTRPRRLQKDELTDFFWKKMPLEDFSKHLAHLYSKYPLRGRIDIYKEAYMKHNYPSEKKAMPQQVNSNTLIEIKPNKVLAIWAKCLEFICSNVEENAFRTWFLPIIPIKLEGNKLTLRLPSLFVYHWIEENYVELMRKTLDQTIGYDAVLEYVM